MDTCSESVCELLVCEGLTLEELLHESLVSTCNGLVESVLVVECYACRTELVLDSCDNAVNVDIVLVSLTDNEECRSVVFLYEIPGLLCTDLDAGGCVYHDDGCRACRESCSCLSCEVEESRSVDEVELCTLELYRNESLVDGVSLFDLHLFVVGYGIAVLDLAESADHLCVEQSCLKECCLAYSAMSQQYDIADLVS